MKKSKVFYRNIIIKSLIVSILLCFWHGCKQKESEKRESELAFGLQEDTYDFGFCEKGEKLFHDFYFSNNGDKNLNIEVKKTSCRCASVKLVKNQYLPGESGYIRINFDTEARIGTIIGNILLTTNDRYNPEVILTVKATVQGVRVKPEKIDFGPIVKGQNVEERIIIESYGLENFTVQKVKTSGKDIMITPVDIDLGRDNSPNFKVFHKEYRVLLVMDHIPMGMFSGKVVIQTNHDINEQFDIPVSANIQGTIQSIPPIISYGVVNAGSKYSRVIRIKSNNNRKIIIKEVSGLLAGMEYSLSAISSDEAQMTLNMIASSNPGLYEGELEISIEQDGVEILHIPYTLLVKE